MRIMKRKDPNAPKPPLCNACWRLDEPLLRLGPGFASHGWFDAVCRIERIRPRVVLESITPHSLIALARTGLGIAMINSVVRVPRDKVRAAVVLHRGAHPVLEFDRAGKFLRSWGDGLISEGKVAGIPKANWAPDKSSTKYPRRTSPANSNRLRTS